MSKLFEQAERRVNSSEALAPHKDFILADWSEGEDHWEWVLKATEKQILDWVQDVKPTFPPEPNNVFYQRFNDPQRAYSNLPALYVFYLNHLDLELPEGVEDYTKYAYYKAHGF